jgi:hypothetical protein
MGYECKIGDTIDVNVNHLSNKSHSIVLVECDYCHKNTMQLPYKEYRRRLNQEIRSITKIINFCCDDCKQKIEYDYLKEFIEKLGNKLISTSFVSAKEKVSYECQCGELCYVAYDTIRAGHGCSRCGHEVAGKKRKNKYDDIKSLFTNSGCTLLTTKEEYELLNQLNRVDFICACGKKWSNSVISFRMGYVRCDECAKKKKDETTISRFGFDNVMKNPEIRAKAFKSLMENNSMPVSLQQAYIHNIVGGELNHLYNSSFLDIAFPEERIYIEYDGGLHDGKVKFGIISQEEFDKKEQRRRYALHRRGWKEIRIISGKDNIPTETKIIEMIEFAKEYISTGHSWIVFNIGKGTVKTSQFENVYDFGSLSRVRKDGSKYKDIINKYNLNRE